MGNEWLHSSGPELYCTLDLDKNETIIFIGQEDIGKRLTGLAAKGLHGKGR